MDQKSSRADLCGGLERRAVHARRRAYSGDLDGASADFAALWPQINQLSPCRHLRILGQYADVLVRQHSVMSFERLRTLAQEAQELCSDLPQDSSDSAAVHRHAQGVVTALIRFSRKVGDGSAVGQTALAQVWALTGAVGTSSLQGSDPGQPSFRQLKENGRPVWIQKDPGEHYRLIRKVHRC